MSRRRRLAIATLCALTLLTLWAMLLIQRERAFYPYVSARVEESLVMSFIHEGRPTEAACSGVVDKIRGAVQAQCPNCEMLAAQCTMRLTPRQRRMLYGHALDTPTIRIPGGAVAFEGADGPLSLKICMETASRAGRQVTTHAQCIPASQDLTQIQLSSSDGKYSTLVSKVQAFLSLLGAAALIGYAVCYLLIHSDTLHGRFSHDHIGSGPQKFHALPTPRIGGLALVIGVIGGVLLMGSLKWLRIESVIGVSLLALSAAPAFVGGFCEDLTKKVGVLARLLLTFAAAGIAAVLLGATIERTGIEWLDMALDWPIVAIAFTVFAVGAIANAVNIIDGYNGLSSGYAMLVLVAVAWVAGQVNDQLVLIGSVGMLGALGGFFLWNYPAGRIFLGDGGAYFLGFWLAELLILLVVRNPDVSPWYAVALLAYPTVETSVSVYRKKMLRGVSPGQPDRLHLHMLIHQRLARLRVGSKHAADITQRNNAVAPYLWALNALVIVPAIFLWQNTTGLVALVLVFTFVYLWLYARLIRWRAPRWLIRGAGKAHAA